MALVSIIVCTRNRSSRLLETLRSIADAAHADSGPVELLIVDNGSSDDTGAVARGFAAEAGFPVHVLDEARPGLSRARNTALDHAQADILAFTDDDCRYAADYLGVLRALYGAESGPALIGGRVELGDPADLPFTIKTDLTAETYSGEQHPGGFLHGCNMTMNRAAFARIGPFDTRFGAGAVFRSAEDTDYLYRAYLAGVPVRYAPTLLVHHFHGRNRPEDILALNRQYAEGNGALYMKYLRHKHLLRNFVWDLRGTLREARGGPPIDPTFGFRYRDNVAGCVRGMWRYVRHALPV